MHRFVLALLSLLVLATPVAASPPPDYYIASPTATLVEWTTWLRGALVVAQSEPKPPDGVVAAVAPSTEHHQVDGAAGAGFTLPLGRRARIGAWVELRGWDTALVGGELTLLPGNLDLFQYKGKSAITMRAGGNPTQLTAQLALAYRAPWDLFGDQPRRSRYMIGTGLVATVTQSRFDPHDWSATVGIDFEPLGAIRYVLGIRSWYH